MSERRYEASKGFPIMAVNFSHHLTACDRCRQFDPKKPATAALLCLDGAVLWKAEHPREKAEPRFRPSTWASKKTVRKVMRYK